jgi:hypothetical protein
MFHVRRAALKSALVRIPVAAAAAVALGLAVTPALGVPAALAATGTADPHLQPGVAPDFDATTLDLIIVTATVSADGNLPAPTGTVAFTVDGSTPAGCASVPVTNGQAACTAGPLTAGFHNLAMSYSGDSNYRPETGGIFLYPVAKADSSVKVAASDITPVFGEGVTFTATVTANGKPVSGGTVQWSVDGTPSGAPVAVGVDGTAVLGPVTTLPVGSHQITAAYSGTDAVNAGTGSVTVAVGKAATTTRLTSATRQALTATVRPVAPGAGQPTGTVTFSIGRFPIGTAEVAANGTAVLRITSSGSGPVTVTYSGDSHFTASASTTVVTPR